MLAADVEEPVALDLGGDDLPTDVIGVADSMPLVGSIGLLSDIRTSAAGSGPTVPSAEVQIVAADGTPQDDARRRWPRRPAPPWRTRSTVRELAR